MDNAVNNAQKLNALRKVMTKNKVGAYLVPRTDEYLNEFIAPYAERLAWLTGFTGSAGLGIIAHDKAMVISDGRYTIQLAQQVDREFYSLENSQITELKDWIMDNLNGDIIIGYDPRLHTPDFIHKLDKAGIKIKPIDGNLIDAVWEDQPEEPMTAISLFPDEIAGQSAKEKLSELQNNMDGDVALITMLDSIAWLLNIRGGDVEHIPVALSTLIVPKKGSALFFVEGQKITNEVREALSDIVEFLSPDDLEESLKNFAGKQVEFDLKNSTVFYQQVLELSGAEIISKNDPCVLPRSCKTKTEQEAMKDAHIVDAVALVKFLHWFDQESNNGKLTELSVEKKLESFRRENENFKEPSFSTIAGFGSNGAIVHYRATEATNKKIEAGNLLLLDSGGQYHYGTTDITRTIAVGVPTEEMIKTNTLVLKGHIALASAEFDEKTTGKELDVLARQYLQAEGLDYAHGTGHGVGCYLSVHEEAPSISPRGEDTYQEGMVLSNEPGYYKEGEFGIRIENLVMVQKSEEEKLYFETITLTPIDKNLIDTSLLGDNEIKWFNDYHAEVFEKVSPLVEGDVKEWLKEATSPL